MQPRLGPRKKPAMTLGLGGLAVEKNTPFMNFSRYVYVILTERHSPGPSDCLQYLLSFSKITEISDPSGRLNFAGKAILHADGVDFTSGNSYKIRRDDLVPLEMLGKGQYGTVHKVHHQPTNVTMGE